MVCYEIPATLTMIHIRAEYRFSTRHTGNKEHNDLVARSDPIQHRRSRYTERIPGFRGREGP